MGNKINYFTIEPEVAGELGEGTILDNSKGFPEVKTLHFVFSGWLGDDLIECFPVFLVSERLKKYLEKSKFSGFSFANCVVSVSDNFILLQKNVILPDFFWLKINSDQRDDFFVNSDKILVLKDDILEEIKTHFTLKNAIIKPTISI